MYRKGSAPHLTVEIIKVRNEAVAIHYSEGVYRDTVTFPPRGDIQL